MGSKMGPRRPWTWPGHHPDKVTVSVRWWGQSQPATGETLATEITDSSSGGISAQRKKWLEAEARRGGRSPF